MNISKKLFHFLDFQTLHANGPCKWEEDADGSYQHALETPKGLAIDRDQAEREVGLINRMSTKDKYQLELLLEAVTCQQTTTTISRLY